MTVTATAANSENNNNNIINKFTQHNIFKKQNKKMNGSSLIGAGLN